MSRGLNPGEDINLLLQGMEEVRDPSKEASEYEFLEEIEEVHSAPSKKGNDALSNAYAELAIYQEDGEVKVDEGLVDELDERLADQHDADSRKRFRNIVMNSGGRKGDKRSLLDQGIDGHGRLLEKIEAFYDVTEEEKSIGSIGFKSLLPNNEYTTRKSQTIDQNQGGDYMTDTEYNSTDHTVSTAIANHNEASKELIHQAARLERKGVDLLDELENLTEEYRESGMNKMRAFQSYLNNNQDTKLSEVEDSMDELYQKVDAIDTSDRGGLSTAIEDQVNSITGWNNY